MIDRFAGAAILAYVALIVALICWLVIGVLW